MAIVAILDSRYLTWFSKGPLCILKVMSAGLVKSEVQWRQRPLSKIRQIRQNLLGLRGLETILELSKISTIVTNFASETSHSSAPQEKPLNGEYIRETFLCLSLLEGSADKTIRRRIKAILSLEVLSYTSVEWQEMAERS